MWPTLCGPVLIGLIWGATNPLISRGVRIVHCSPAQPYTGVAAVDGLLRHALQPAWLLPQLANLVGSVLFAYLLGSGNISIVAPVANGITLATTAIGDHFLGDRMPLSRGLLGLALVWLGVLLCTQ